MTPYSAARERPLCMMPPYLVRVRVRVRVRVGVRVRLGLGSG
jgi:hypothetical protein